MNPVTVGLAVLSGLLLIALLWVLLRRTPAPRLQPALSVEIVYPYRDCSIGIFVINHSDQWLHLTNAFLTVMHKDGAERPCHWWPTNAAEPAIIRSMMPKSSFLAEFMVTGPALASYEIKKYFATVRLKNGQVFRSQIATPPAALEYEVK